MLLSCAVFAEKKDKAQAPTPVKTLLRDARTAIKNKRDQNKQVGNLQAALAREDVSNEQRAEMLYTQSQLHISLNEAENMKAYLKQKYDTAVYFNTVLDASRCAMLCDSVDVLPDAKGRVKPVYRKKNAAALLKYRPNVYAGGRFYLRRNNFKASLPFFSTYIDMLEHPLLKGNATLLGDTLLKRASFYATVSAYNCGAYGEALKYVDMAIEGAEPRTRPNLQEYKVRCYEALGDSVNMLDAMYDGCESYPLHDYFFTHLIDYFDNEKQYDIGLELADTMLSRVQDIPLYWYAKSLMYLHKEDWNNCVEMCDSTLRREPSHVDALRNKGIALLNVASEFAETACYDMNKPQSRSDRRKLMKLYSNAMPSFERLRGIVPDKPDMWAPHLYRIYLQLNMGKEFAEVERILREMKKSE